MLVQRPCAGRGEALWRPNRLYDVLIVVGYNHAPVQSPPCATR
jgi:hypothetical protein